MHRLQCGDATTLTLDSGFRGAVLAVHCPAPIGLLDASEGSNGVCATLFCVQIASTVLCWTYTSCVACICAGGLRTVAHHGCFVHIF